MERVRAKFEIDIFSIGILVALASISYVLYNVYVERDFIIFTTEEDIESAIYDEYGFLAEYLI